MAHTFQKLYWSVISTDKLISILCSVFMNKYVPFLSRSANFSSLHQTSNLIVIIRDYIIQYYHKVPNPRVT